ncbi:MAG: hypothetical protein GY806_12320 [Gammaproteobacteria bacterium]|nr:hypothetical protein [Gammaproteobacteria bacterium]
MNKQQALQESIKLTDEILVMLDNQEFDRIAELELQREPLIKQVFTETVERIDYIKAIHLQKLNQQVVEKLTELRSSVLLRQKQIRKASKATQAYSDNQNGNSGLLASG